MAETLNLVKPDDILSLKYEISRFPDGQQSIRIIEDGYNSFYSLKENPNGIIIKSRLNTFQDLELIICTNQALKELGVKRVRLYIPYCLGGRSDRKFLEGGINYIKQVIAPIINSQNFDEVKIMDPHSDVIEACINNFVKIDTSSFIRFSFSDYFMSKGFEVWDKMNFDNVGLVSPDAGALKKIFTIADKLGYTQDIIVCSKHRDNEGNLSRTTVPLTDDVMNKDLFIIDDICDGGRTFINVAKTIKENKSFKGDIYLIVTHGIFSYGFDTLSEYFDKIYTTNSVKDIQNGTIINTFSKNKTIHSLVKQLNIF